MTEATNNPKTLNSPKTLTQKICAAFSEHPAATGETYFEHLLFTLKLAGTLALCMIAVFIHGLLPFLCTTTASRRLERLQNVLDERNAAAPKDQ